MRVEIYFNGKRVLFNDDNVKATTETLEAAHKAARQRIGTAGAEKTLIVIDPLKMKRSASRRLSRKQSKS